MVWMSSCFFWPYSESLFTTNIGSSFFLLDVSSICFKYFCWGRNIFCTFQGFIPMVVPDMLKGVVFVSSFSCLSQYQSNVLKLLKILLNSIIYLYCLFNYDGCLILFSIFLQFVICIMSEQNAQNSALRQQLKSFFPQRGRFSLRFS